MDEVMFKTTPLEYYSQMMPIDQVSDTSFFTDAIDQLTADLAAIRINFYYIRWTEKIVSEGPEFEYEYFIEDLEEDEKSLGRIYVSERHVFWASTSKNRPIGLHHYIQPDLIAPVNEILLKYFPRRTLGIENASTTIRIHLDVQDNIEPQQNIIDLLVYLYYNVDSYISEEDLRALLHEDVNILDVCNLDHYQQLMLEIPEQYLPDTISKLNSIEGITKCEINNRDNCDE